ncbi:hypothetical protein GCM10028787_29550 [Brachybacterium horti]
MPLGLHWPLNALMLQNINALGYDFIQGPMGAWNFACFGATAGVLLLSLRHREPEMRQTATGALAAGLFGGISEPSLYGIHLRFKRIYPRMLVGCLVGGLIVGLLGGVDTSAFAFTSLLTIPVFDPIPVYVIAIAAAFVTAMVLVYFSDYMPREQRAAANAARDLREADERAAATAAPESSGSATSTTSATTTAPVAGAATATTDGADAAAGTAGGAAPTATLLAEADLEIVSPVAGRVLDLDDAGDPVFASRALGEGVGVEPADGTVLAPLDGELITVAGTGHAFGIRGAGGVEVLVHVGIDTVQMNGEGFDVRVEAGQQVRAGDLLAEVDLAAIRAAGHPALTLVTVINTASLTEVRPLAVGEQVAAGAPVVAVRR